MQKGRLRNSVLAMLPKLALMATATACVCAGSTAQAAPVAVIPLVTPEVGTWTIGAGVFAILGIEFLRRKYVRNNVRGSVSAD